MRFTEALEYMNAKPDELGVIKQKETKKPLYSTVKGQALTRLNIDDDAKSLRRKLKA